MAEGDNSNASSSTSKPASSSSGSGLGHRIGPLPVWAWVAVVVGAVLLYKVLKGNSASSSTTASGTVGATNGASSLFGSEGFSSNSAGEVIDNATGDILGTFGGSTGSGSTSSTGTFEGWTTSAQQALFNLGYDNTAVDQALQDYASGQQLPQNEYGIIEAAINLIGNPPSSVALPQLQPPAAPAAPAPSSPTPAAPAPAPPSNNSNENAPLSGSLIQQMVANGEHVISSYYDAADNTQYYLTNLGGVYTVGNGFFGSVFSLGSEFVGTPTQITGNSLGGYTVVNNQGQTYNFGPSGTGADYANATNGKGAT